VDVTEQALAEQILLTPVPANDLYAWIKAKDLIEKAIERADHWDLDDVLHQYIDGRVQLSMVSEGSRLLGVMISEVQRYPKKQVLFIHGFAVSPGHSLEWFDSVWSQILDLARANRCQSVSASGRTGWLRKVPEARNLNVWEVTL
jgi:hypothetical protein